MVRLADEMSKVQQAIKQTYVQLRSCVFPCLNVSSGMMPARFLHLNGRSARTVLGFEATNTSVKDKRCVSMCNRPYMGTRIEGRC